MLKRNKVISVLILAALIATYMPYSEASAEENKEHTKVNTEVNKQNANNGQSTKEEGSKDTSKDESKDTSKDVINKKPENPDNNNQNHSSKDEANENVENNNKENNNNQQAEVNDGKTEETNNNVQDSKNPSNKEEANNKEDMQLNVNKDAKSDAEIQGYWVKKDNKWYFYNNAGEMQKGWILNNGHRYYLDLETGIMQSNWFKIDGKWYYAEDSGALKKGWEKYNGYWYFIHEDGKMATGFINDGGKKYYLNEDGIMQTGVINVDGKVYISDSSGAIESAKWVKKNDKWYFISENGNLATGWLKDNNVWYYLNSDGVMQTGWVKDNNVWYYLAENGAMKTGWLKDRGYWYYLNESGKMLTGELSVDGKQYYLHSNGQMAAFQYINNKYYGKNGAYKDFANGEKILVVIDPGHNFGGDDGAYATHNGITYIERDLNMQLAMKLKAKLEERGFEVKLTREPQERPMDDLRTSLRKRVELANNLNTDFFISIHHDSFTNPNAYGISSYYSTYRPNIESDGLVDAGDDGYRDTTPSVAAEVSRDFAKGVLGNLQSGMNYYNRGSRDTGFYVTKNTTMPAILLECGFITNPTEAKKIADQNNQLKFADNVAGQFAKIFPMR